jgi:hypothetical protein
MEPEDSLPHLQVPVTVPILSHLDPVSTPTSYLCPVSVAYVVPEYQSRSEAVVIIS